MIFNERKDFSLNLSVTLAVILKYFFVSVEMSLLGLTPIWNTCPNFFLGARLIRTPGNTDTR